jgi:hypothetical protein
MEGCGQVGILKCLRLGGEDVAEGLVEVRGDVGGEGGAAGGVEPEFGLGELGIAEEVGDG